jgi:multidrug efflux pump subunit AcrA (membrane-fusion protein)/YHS domain-containing protein
MSDIQLKRLAKTMKITDSVQIFSPADGFILARNVSPGPRFEKGTELYRIADLSHVWIVADIYESDAQSFAPGTIATVTLAGHQKPMHARVSQVLPQFDPATRTMKLRLEAENPGFILRPDMFVDIELPVHLPAGLTVPVDSVLDSGMKKHVFLDRGNGSFEAREVETGWRFGDRVQVVKGLAAGDRVVVSGTFLLDSESRLRDAQQRVSAPGDARKALPTAAEAVAMPKTKVAGIPASAIDPACGMPVKPTESVSAGNTESYRGQTYYFCSSACRNKFHADPGHTLSSRTAGSSPQAAR